MCVSRLVHPCVAAATVQGGVYESAVRKVSGMMAHLSGFSARSARAVAAAGQAGQRAHDENRGDFVFEETGLVVMTPSAARDDAGGAPRGDDARCDFSVDFDTENAWSIGLSPTIDTDAAEAAQVVLGALGVIGAAA